MLISDFDVALLRWTAARRAAEKVGVPDADFLTTAELEAEVALRDPALGAALIEFAQAYQAWIEFHQDIEKRGLVGKLSPSLMERMTTATERKDEARREFIAELKR